MKYEAITAGLTYHIYNRGNNGDIVFSEADNYEYFLFLMRRHLFPVSDIYAYCIMSNHFHIVLRVKEETDLPENFRNRPSQAFSNMFNGFAKAMNIRTGRTGSLFEKNFERKLISDEMNLRNVISYVHCNPVSHGVCKHFSEYPYSSIKEYIGGRKQLIEQSFPLQLFDGIDSLITFHESFQNRKESHGMN